MSIKRTPDINNLKMKKQILTLALAATAATAAMADGTVIYGAIDGYYPGIYKINTEAPASPEQLYSYNGMNTTNCGGVFTTGRFAYIGWDSSSSWSKPALKGYNHNGEWGEWTADPWIENLPVTSAHTALALDPLTDTVYGCFYNEDKTTFFFGTFNDKTGESQKICELNERLNSMAFTEMGKLYAISISGKLLTRGSDGSFTEVGQLNVKPQKTKAAGAAIDSNGVMYWSVYDSNYDYGFYTIDLETATATKVCDLSSSSYMTAMTIPAAVPGPDAPAALTDFNATSEGFETDLTVSFTVPSETVGGESIMGGLKAYVVIDGDIKTDAQIVGPGTSFSQTYSLTDGQHTVVAFVTNYAGTEKSAKSNISVFVGQDLPGAVVDLMAVKNDKSIQLTWEAPTKGTSGGAFDATTLTYNVKNITTDEMLAEGLTDCEYTYPVEGDELRRIQFEVVAVTSRGTGPATATESFLLGEGYAVPYTENFDGKDLDETYFTFINANEDAKEWYMYTNTNAGTSSLKLDYNSTKSADDWAITAPIILRKNHEYKLAFTYVTNRYPTDRLEVKIGTEPTVEAMTAALMETKDYPTNNSTPDEITFSVETSGIYYIGLHALNNADTYAVTLDDISVTYADEDHADPTTAPVAIDDLVVESNDLNVSVKFTVSTKTTDGGNHPDVNRVELYRDNECIHTYKYVEAGDELTYDETLVKDGEYEYAVVAYNAAGASEKSSSTVIAGNIGSLVKTVSADGIRMVAGGIYVGSAANIYTIDGTYAGSTSSAGSVRLPAGLYIVKCGTHTFKCVVR